MSSYAIKFGVVAGLVMVVVFSITFPLTGGENPNYRLGEIIGYTTMILSLLVVYFGIRSYRDNELGGTISYGKAVSTGVLITIIAALVFAIFDTVYVTVINPDFFSEYMSFEIDSMRAKGASDAEIKAYEAQFDAFVGPLGPVLNAFVMFVTVFLIGLIISLVSSALLKNTGGNPAKESGAAPG